MSDYRVWLLACAAVILSCLYVFVDSFIRVWRDSSVDDTVDAEDDD